MEQKKIFIEGQGYMDADKFLPYGADMEFFALVNGAIYVKRSNERYEFLKKTCQKNSQKTGNTGRVQ